METIIYLLRIIGFGLFQLTVNREITNSNENEDKMKTQVTQSFNQYFENETKIWRQNILRLQLHDAIYRLRFCSNSFIHILSLSKSHNNVASIQKNRGDKSHSVIVA